MSEEDRGMTEENIVDTLSGQVRPLRRAALALGSNIGDRLEMLQSAVTTMVDSSEVHPLAVSPVYETHPVGGPDGQEPYLNAVLVVDTTAPARLLLERALATEDAYGRTREEQWAPRTLDIDLLAYGPRVYDDPECTVPHPRLHERAFVLAPWNDVDPDFEVPGHGRVGDLLTRVDAAGVRRLDDVHLVLPA
jgi:2-amino-4-hydroxy-6-hydroxymethyldihydropteridine diphosphokinase